MQIHRRHRQLSFAIIFALAAVGLFAPTSALALNARLSWSPIGNAAGYKIYVRPSNGVYGTGLDVGPQSVSADGEVHFTVANVSAGAFLAVSTYDAGGTESTRSNELALPSATPTVAVTATPVRTATAIVTATPVRTATAIATTTPVRTTTPVPTSTAVPTIAPTQIATAVATVTVARTATPAATQTPIPTLTSGVTGTPVPTSAATPSIVDLSMLGTIIARVTAPTGGGNHAIEVIRDDDMPPAGSLDSSRQYDTYDGANAATEDWIGYAYPAPRRFNQVLFQEGRHFWNGGWFASGLRVQVRQNGVWVDIAAAPTPAYPGVNAITYEIFRWTFPGIVGDAIRIYGRPGGSAAFISVGELRVYGDASVAPPPNGLADVTKTGIIIARVTAPTGGGNHNLEVIRDGDMPPVGSVDSSRQYDTYDGANAASVDWIGYVFQVPQRFRRVVFQEGRHFWDGGWFDSLALQVRQNGVWTTVNATVTPAYPGLNALTYETFVFDLPETTGDGIRIYGAPGGTADFISVGELRVYVDTTATQIVTSPDTTGTAGQVDSGSGDAPIATTSSPDAPATSGGEPPATDGAPTPIVVVTPSPDDTTPEDGVCGDGQRTGVEACDGADDGQCPGRCRSDCTCGVVIALPLDGWSAPADDAIGTLGTDAAGTAVLDVTAVPTDGADVWGLVYPPDGDELQVALPQLAVRARADASFDVTVSVRSVDGTRYDLTYRAADPAPGTSANAPVTTDGTHATFAIGAAMASGELGTTYRDLTADLRAAFGVPFAAVLQVRVAGTVDLYAVTLASDRGRDEDTASEVTLPLAGWTTDGTAAVVEDGDDPALPGLILSAAPTDRFTASYPADGDTLALPFATFAFAVRDAADFAVDVRVVTTAGDDVVLTYELGRTDVDRRLHYAELPLFMTARPSGPYSDVRLDVAGDLARLYADAAVAAVTSVRLHGGFTVGDVRLRDPLSTTATR